MSVTYATDDNTNYRLSSALAVDDWPKVTSVRLELVVRSIDNNAVAEKQTYKFANTDAIPKDIDVVPAADDRYLRQVFSVTVGIRNRAINIQ
jgi:type IV pilus assembly protein PilW